MKKKWKIALAVAVVLIAAVAVTAGIKYNQRGIVTVQTGKVARQDLTSLVTASGEIKPRNYINLGANTMGPARITQILVVEGDRVKKGQVVARLESVQAEAEVAAQRAAVGSSEADSSANEASLRAGDQAIITAQAFLERAKADLDRARIDFQRTEKLWNEKLVARQEYDTRQSALAAAEAGLKEAESRIDQEKARRQQIAAQLNAQQRRVSQVQANLRRASDVLDKYNVYSPIDGVVTNLPVRVGETVVPGIQNSPASTVMTVADMSLITAEVKVDETDIVNVKLGQTCRCFHRRNTQQNFQGPRHRNREYGDTSLHWFGCVAERGLQPGSERFQSGRGAERSAGRDSARSLLHGQGDHSHSEPGSEYSDPGADSPPKGRPRSSREGREGQGGQRRSTPSLEKARKEELQGVFVVSGEKAEFRKVETGITGTTDIEVTSGLNEGDQIITGSYKVIRTLRNDTKIKVDNQGSR